MTDQLLEEARRTGEEIILFLKLYGKRGADGEWTSPDAFEMESVAALMMNGHLPGRVPFSEWGSGGYQPYLDRNASDRHDGLKAQVAKLIESAKGEQTDIESRIAWEELYDRLWEFKFTEWNKDDR